MRTHTICLVFMQWFGQCKDLWLYLVALSLSPLPRVRPFTLSHPSLPGTQEVPWPINPETLLMAALWSQIGRVCVATACSHYTHLRSHRWVQHLENPAENITWIDLHISADFSLNETFVSTDHAFVRMEIDILEASCLCLTRSVVLF